MISQNINEVSYWKCREGWMISNTTATPTVDSYKLIVLMALEIMLWYIQMALARKKGSPPFRIYIYSLFFNGKYIAFLLWLSIRFKKLFIKQNLLFVLIGKWCSYCKHILKNPTKFFRYIIYKFHNVNFPIIVVHVMIIPTYTRI